MNLWQLQVPDGWRRRLTAHELGRVLDDVNAYVDRIRDNGPELLYRAKAAEREAGFPSSTRPKIGGSSSGECDHGDPVGELMANDPRSDAPQELAAVMCELVMVGRDILRRADNAWGRAVPPATLDEEPAGGPWCVVHARYKLWEPVRARGRCRWCKDFAGDHDFRDPSEDEIRDLERHRMNRAA